MITSLSLENFRCFERLNLSDLKRVVVITGASGTGKTALLEAILIAAKGHPDAVIRVNRARALPEAMVLNQLQGGPVPAIVAALTQSLSPMSPQAFYNLWASLFGDTSKPVGLSYRDNGGIEKSLKISFNNSPEVGLPLLAMPTREGVTSKAISFERMSPKLPTELVTAFLNQGGQITFSKAQEDLGPTTFFFGSGGNFSETDNISWFSDLKVAGTASTVIDLLIDDFPFIRDLEVLSPGGIQAIYAVLTNGSVRSLSLVSSGIHKTFSLYCGVSGVRGGVVLLDEIENGIYYERYTDLWEKLRSTCISRDNQLFVTVHSLECLKALLPVVAQHTSDFCLLRTEQDMDRCFVKYITGKAMRAALQGDVDLRGTAKVA